MLPRLLSMVLRATALAGKLAIFIALARYLDDAEIGLYGLIAASVAYCTFITGMEFYNYSIREVAKSDISVQAHAIINHIFFVSSAQVLLIVLALLFWVSSVFEFELTLIVLVVIALEQWAQEGYRLLVALARPVLASVTLFMRQGAWVFIVIIGFYFFQELRTLEFVLGSWLVGLGFSTLISGFVLFRHTGLPNLARVDLSWIYRGLSVAFTFYGAAFGLMTINVLDRLLQDRLGSDAALAAYVFFFGISVTLVAALDAGIFSFAFPKIIFAGRRSTKDITREIIAITFPTIIATTVFWILAIMFFEFGLELLEIGHYKSFSYIYYTLLLSISLQAWSMIPHLGLYAVGADKVILFGNVISLLAFIIFTFILQNQPDIAVALARAGAFGFLLGWKVFFFALHIRNS